MAEKEATGELSWLEEQDFAPKLGQQNLDQDKAENEAAAKSIQDTDGQGFMDLDYEHVYYDAPEDADDEIDTEDDYEDIQPLNIKKAKTGKDNDQDSAEVSHTAPTALERNLSRAQTPYPEPLSVHQFSDLLHPSPPLRHRKGSMALRKKDSDSAAAKIMMSKTGEDHDALYSHDQGHAVESGENSEIYQTPTHRGKMPEARRNPNAFSPEDQGNAADIDESIETPTSSEDQVLNRKTTGSRKADAVLGYGDEDRFTPKGTTNLVTSPKVSHEKKSARKLFYRKGSKESITPPSSSGKTAGRMQISAPTFVDASPDAKILLSSASSLVDASPDAKNVVNYSRPIAHHSSSDVFNGSPVVRGRSSSALYGSNPFSGPSTSLEGFTGNSGNIPIDLGTSMIHGHCNTSVVRGNPAADGHGTIFETLATEKDPNASDSDSFNPSDYSGDENSVRQAKALPIAFSGRANLVNVRSAPRYYTAALGSRSGVGSVIAPGATQLTDHDAEVLGAQDADRYIAHAMASRARHAATNTDDPFIDPAFQNLLAKPANEIAAKEMARIKAAREAANMDGGLMERMNALLAKSDTKPGVQNVGETITGPRTNTGESLLSKMRAVKKKSKKGKEQDSEEEVVRKVEAEKERGLREEREIHAKIKAQLAAKDAANGGVRGAGIPRIDYGSPNLHTALGGCGPTDEERAHASALADRLAAGLTGGRVQNKQDNTTARGQFEGLVNGMDGWMDDGVIFVIFFSDIDQSLCEPSGQGPSLSYLFTATDRLRKTYMIILIRHAQSEGNKNRDIHQTIPDHRVKLTQDGWKQAEEAGQKLRSLLRPSDTLHFFTSPYRRTRETTEGILNALTSPAPDHEPSPFPRHTIKVYEEPRLREQDFGNFQPDSAEMSRMWQERADYGHFFYRIPNGESAADAYDRVSGFNESLWRSFGESDFASVCVLVTHGLMTRVFLMKWYHFSVEYFEDLRNVNHCEFVVMKLNEDNGKYVLQNQLRTWSELKRERANSRSSITEPESPIPVRKKWGGCLQSDGDRGDDFARRQMARRRKDTKDLFEDYEMEHGNKETGDGKKADGGEGEYPRGREDKTQALEKQNSQTDAANVRLATPGARKRIVSPNRLEILKGGRDGGGSRSGAASPSRSSPDDSEAEAKEHMRSLPLRRSMAMALNGELDGDGERVRADALGDQSDVEDDEEEEHRKEVAKMEATDKSFEGAVS